MEVVQTCFVRPLVTLKDCPVPEQPVHRLHSAGAAALSQCELLAVLVGGTHQIGVAVALQHRFKSLKGIARSTMSELQEIPYLGKTGAARLKAALQLGRRLYEEDDHARPHIRSPADAANLVMMEMSLLEREELRLILLNTKNRVLEIPTVYVGNLNSSIIRVGELFTFALRANAASMVALHNHPSGDPTPSPEDVRVTESIVAAGELLDIELMDHIIIGGNRFVSLKERRLGFK